MKKIYFLVAILSLVLASCSSPEGDAQKIVDKYSDQIKNYSSCKTISEFKDLQESSVASIKEDYIKAESKYKSDEGQWNLFLFTYQNGLETANSEFMAAFTNLVDSILTMKEWYERTDAENGYYLFAFNNDSMNIMNCKKGISYSLMADTITFDDENRTKMIVSTKDSTLVFTSLKTNKQCKLNNPTENSKFYGSWSTRYYIVNATCTFYPSGTFHLYVNQGGQRVSQNYSWALNGDKLKCLTPNHWDPYTIISDDHFSLVDYEGTTWNFYRIKKATPKNAEEILFE